MPVEMGPDGKLRVTIGRSPGAVAPPGALPQTGALAPRAVPTSVSADTAFPSDGAPGELDGGGIDWGGLLQGAGSAVIDWFKNNGKNIATGGLAGLQALQAAQAAQRSNNLSDEAVTTAKSRWDEGADLRTKGKAGLMTPSQADYSSITTQRSNPFATSLAARTRPVPPMMPPPPPSPSPGTPPPDEVDHVQHPYVPPPAPGQPGSPGHPLVPNSPVLQPGMPGYETPAYSFGGTARRSRPMPVTA